MNVENKILELYRVALLVKSENRNYIDLRPLNDVEINQMKILTGKDFRGYVHQIDVSAIRHCIKRHPDITEADFLLIPSILKLSKIKRGNKPDTFVFIAELVHSYYYVEYERSGRKKLAMKTFYKKIKPPGRSGR